MSDKTQAPKEVKAVEEVDKTEAEETPIENGEEKVENGDKTNEDSDAQETSKEASGDKEGKEDEAESDGKCSVKRKSTGGGDSTDSAPVEAATPEKKAKLDESKEEAKGNAEVAA